MDTLKSICFIIGMLVFICFLLSFATGCVPEPEEKGYYTKEMNVIAYCTCEKCCQNWADGITASGKPAIGKIIAAPMTYPLGTVMEVPGYGKAEVQDRGGA